MAPAQLQFLLPRAVVGTYAHTCVAAALGAADAAQPRAACACLGQPPSAWQRAHLHAAAPHGQAGLRGGEGGEPHANYARVGTARARCSSKISTRSCLHKHPVLDTSTCGLAAMTSASHAEGRQFDPGQVYALSHKKRSRVWAGK